MRREYNKDDCDLILVVDSKNGDCYIIPVDHIQKWGTSKSLSKLKEYKEKWEILEEIVEKTN